MKDALNLLKEKFCQGEKEVLYEMLEIVFQDLWLQLMSNSPHPKANHLGGLITKIYNHPELLCEAEGTVEEILKKQLNRVAREVDSKDGDYHEEKDYSNEENEDSAYIVDQETGLLPIHAIFQSSLDEMSKISYEIMFVQKWKQRPGSRQLLLFLVNALSFGNYHLLKSLKNHPANYAEILNWFIGRLKEMFYNEKEVVEDWSTFSKSDFFNINESLEKQFKTQNQNLKRKRNVYGKLRLDLTKENWSEVEIYFYLIYKYMGVESLVELWFQMNIFGLIDEQLKNELKLEGLWRDEIQVTDEGMKQVSIINKYLGKKRALKFSQQLETIQNRVNSKLEKPPKWKTYSI